MLLSRQVSLKTYHLKVKIHSFSAVSTDFINSEASNRTNLQNRHGQGLLATVASQLMSIYKIKAFESLKPDTSISELPVSL